jgi:RNA polymerase sigma-B factor
VHALLEPQSVAPVVDAADPRNHWQVERRELNDAAMRLFRRLHAMPADHPGRREIRDQIITTYLPVAGRLAARYASGRDHEDDLGQIAAVGLIKAVDGFDVNRGVPFAGYAVPTILGEIKRYFRDHCWDVRVSRSVHDRYLRLRGAVEELTRELGHAPRIGDLAERLDLTEEAVIEALESAHAYDADSLNASARRDVPAGELGDLIGAPDPALEHVEDRLTLLPALASLPARQQRIIALRFYANQTQTQIAERLGISQMHVSRLLSRSLTRLRERMLADIAHECSRSGG